MISQYCQKVSAQMACSTVTFMMLVAALPANALEQQLSSERLASQSDASLELQITAGIDSGLARSIAELEQVVNINSGTLNFAGVRKVGQVFAEQLQEIGAQTQWLDGESFDRAGHLLATINSTNKGSRIPKILLIGHLDTVFAKDDEFHKFQALDDKQVAGPGITDMKGGNVIIVAALRALKSAGVLDQLHIKVIMLGDEERSGKPLSESKKALIDAAKWADIALGFEDGDGNIKTAVIARRGSLDWQLNVSGKPAHSSQIFQADVGFGAVFEAARILNAFREQLADYGDLTFNPGLIVGGTTIDYEPQSATGHAFGKNNVIAQTVKVTGGLRTLTSAELQHAKRTMQDIVKNNLAHTSAELIIGDGYPPLAPSVGNRQLLAQYSQVSEDLGFGPVVAVNPRNAGAADISFTAGHVDMALDGLGLMGKGGHTKDEVADISTLAQNAKKAAVLLYRLSQQD